MCISHSLHSVQRVVGGEDVVAPTVVAAAAAAAAAAGRPLGWRATAGADTEVQLRRGDGQMYRGRRGHADASGVRRRMHSHEVQVRRRHRHLQRRSLGHDEEGGLPLNVQGLADTEAGASDARAADAATAANTATGANATHAAHDRVAIDTTTRSLCARAALLRSRFDRLESEMRRQSANARRRNSRSASRQNRANATASLVRSRATTMKRCWQMAYPGTASVKDVPSDRGASLAC